MTAIDLPYLFNSRPANNRNRRIMLAPAEVGYLNGHRPFNLAAGTGQSAPKQRSCSRRSTEILRPDVSHFLVRKEPEWHQVRVLG
jgi:hypothetical protein